MTLRSGGLFAGYGGLDMAVTEVFGAEPAWFSEIEPGPSKILAHHWPTVPNHGDITTIDWDAVEPVDILSGGFPCQDVSAAGKRAGLKPGTRSGLWNHMAYAISKLRPRYVVAENVRGLLSAEAHSDVEPCPWCLGEGTGEPDLRALGAVLGDLAELGYDAQWCGLRAADVGAPHGRYRIFVVASDTASIGGGSSGEANRQPHRADRARRTGELARDTQVRGRNDARLAIGRGGSARSARGPGLTVADSNKSGPQGGQPAAGFDLPAWGTAADTGSNGRQRRTKLDRGTVGGIEASLGYDADGCGHVVANSDRDPVREQPVSQSGSGGSSLARFTGPDSAERGSSPAAWGQYGPAIERWERVLGRVAPAPTEPGAKGGQRLAPRFVEWMQGLPAGHVTDVPGVNRNAQLKALGNGVVPQQAIAALLHMHANATQLLETA